MKDKPPADPTRRIKHRGGWAQRIELPALRLVAISGPDKGRSWTFSLPVIRMGKGPDNDLVLTDDSVSRHHAKITQTSQGILLTDLDSTNGSYVRGVRTKEAFLELKMEFRVGETMVGVEPRTEEFFVVPSEEESLGPLVGQSEAMRQVYGMIRAVAATEATVLIQGESGTGKELTARAIHELSQRTGSVVVFDCASTSTDLIRSELFGHVEGAFTGAQKARDGAFRHANEGTLFIDEIGELPTTLQPNLLRVLESREVQPVGSDVCHPVNVRLIAATNRDLDDMVAKSTFREDLFHRLAVVTIHLPPLRERKEDIPLLIQHYCTNLGLGCHFSPAAIVALQEHDWSGNVRALRNLVERMGVMYRDQEIKPEQLDLKPSSKLAASGPLHKLADVERQTILSALQKAANNKAQAARVLGISLSTLKRKLKEYNQEVDD